MRTIPTTVSSRQDKNVRRALHGALATMLIAFLAACGTTPGFEDIVVEVHDVAPQGVSAIRLLDDAPVSGSTTLTVRSNPRFDAVRFYLDGASEPTHVDDEAPFEYVLDTTHLRDGVHELTVEADVTRGGAARRTIEFTVQNDVPSPSDGGTSGGDEASAGDGSDGSDDGVPLPGPGPTGDLRTISYEEDHGNFPNPERGLYLEGDPGKYAYAADQGYRLAMRYIRLDAYRYDRLPESLLEDIGRDFAAARESGLKLIVRFAYNRSRNSDNDYLGDDAPLDVVLTHIDQLGPILHEYADVIATLQGGFIGAWGEWHSSEHGLTDHSARKAIADALLEALPETRMIQIRYPYYARDMYDLPTELTRFDGTDASRIGLLNDCFLATSSDGGTYISDEDRSYTEAVTPYTVMGGETCSIGGLHDRNDGDVALEETDRYHWDYLNSEFYRGVLDKWRDQGLYDEIVKQLGYRYTLREATTETAVQPGDTLDMSLTVENTGFGKLYNPRPLDLVLTPRDGGAPTTLRVYDDARTVLPLPGDTREIPLTARIPADMSGTYDIHLALPDASPNLTDTRYAIRLANTDTWNAATGTNDLHAPVTVTALTAVAD